MLARLAAGALAVALVAAGPEHSRGLRDDGVSAEDIEPLPEPGWSLLERMGSLGGDFISGVAATHVGGNRVVTAVRNEAGNLKVIVCRSSTTASSLASAARRERRCRAPASRSHRCSALPRPT